MIPRELTGKPFGPQCYRTFDPLAAYHNTQRAKDTAWIKAQIEMIRKTSNSDQIV